MLKYIFAPRGVLSPYDTDVSCNPLPPGLARLQQGKKAAKKREDFEKMKEISAHMDNIIQRFENLFRCHESGEETTALPKLPPLPQPEPVKDSRHRSVSARPMTVDQAVSAWRLTTERAVSVASGLHFDDELSGKWRANQSDSGLEKHVVSLEFSCKFYQSSSKQQYK